MNVTVEILGETVETLGETVDFTLFSKHFLVFYSKRRNFRLNTNL